MHPPSQVVVDYSLDKAPSFHQNSWRETIFQGLPVGFYLGFTVVPWYLVGGWLIVQWLLVESQSRVDVYWKKKRNTEGPLAFLGWSTRRLQWQLRLRSSWIRWVQSLWAAQLSWPTLSGMRPSWLLVVELGMNTKTYQSGECQSIDWRVTCWEPQPYLVGGLEHGLYFSI